MAAAMSTSWLPLLVLLLSAAPASDGKVIQGYLRTGDNWAFLSRFCFLSMHGKFQYEVSCSYSRRSRKFS